MNLTIARTIGYTLLLVVVNFVNAAWLHDTEQGFITLFILGSVVGEMGIPAVLPKMVEKEKEIITRFTGPPPHSNWRRIAIVIILVSMAIAGTFLTANAVSCQSCHHPPNTCTKSFK